MKIKFLLFIALFLAGNSVVHAQTQKAPMYYSLYAYLYTINKNSTSQYAMPENMWKEHIDYISTNLAPIGFDMICTDGWGESIKNGDGFRVKHHGSWNNDFAYWGNYCTQKGVKMGLYENPLWLNGANSHMYSGYPALWFKWIDINHSGAEDYIKRYIQYYASFGVKYLRVDFMSWYEDGRDKNPDFEVRHNRPVADYIKALGLLNKYCDLNNMQLSLVMPHLKDDAKNERLYASGSLVRVNEDQCEGKWFRLSEIARGKKHIDSRTNENMWSLFHNTFDGMIYWSKYSGLDASKNELILDGDFIWLSSFANEEEKKTALTINLVAGAAIALTEYHISDIQKSIQLLQNQEVFALNKQGFVGKPLSHDPTNSSADNQAKTQVWRGKMPNSNDYIVALFNREASASSRTINFSDLPDNVSTKYQVRDLWAKADVGIMENAITMNVGSHACKLFRLSPVSPASCNRQTQQITIDSIANVNMQNYSGNTLQITASANSGLPLTYSVSGPATISGNVITIAGTNGTVIVTAAQSGNATYCPASKQTSFNVSGACQKSANMYIGSDKINNWALSNTPMKYVENCKWQAALDLTAGTYLLKFANTSNWTGKDWGNATGLEGTCTESTGKLPNLSFTISAANKYMITFNENTLAYSIKPDIGTFLDKVSATDIKIHLSSSNEELIIDLGNNHVKGEAKFYSTLGKLLYSTSLSSDLNFVAINSAIASGLVILVVETEKDRRSFKIVVP